MPIIHTNARGDHYYLHVGTTRTGKPKYFFSKKETGDLALATPDGFEVYEDADARVTLRRMLPLLITDAELAVVERELKKCKSILRYHLDRKRKLLTVSVAEHNPGVDLVRQMFPFDNEKFEVSLLRMARLIAAFRFELVDDKKRLFQAYRYCYLGDIDDWIEIGSPGSLAEVAREFIPHAGKDSYYDLM
jgi:hypothetical protein